MFYDRINVQDASKNAYAFKGSLAYSLDDYKLISWNYKVGTCWLYNENIQEIDTSSISLALIEAAHHNAYQPNRSMMILSKEIRKGENVYARRGLACNWKRYFWYMTFDKKLHTPIYESGNAFLVCGNMNYSEERYMGIVQGVSTPLPILGHFEF